MALEQNPKKSSKHIHRPPAIPILGTRPLFSFSKLLGIFFKVINTNNPAFDPNSPSLPVQEKSCQHFFSPQVRDSHETCQGDLRWQLLSTFSTSKLQAKSRVRVTCRLVDKMFVTTMMEFLFQKFLLMNLGARKLIPGKESSWLILLRAPPFSYLARQAKAPRLMEG